MSVEARQICRSRQGSEPAHRPMIVRPHGAWSLHGANPGWTQLQRRKPAYLGSSPGDGSSIGKVRASPLPGGGGEALPDSSAPDPSDDGGGAVELAEAVFRTVLEATAARNCFAV